MAVARLAWFAALLILTRGAHAQDIQAGEKIART